MTTRNRPPRSRRARHFAIPLACILAGLTAATVHAAWGPTGALVCAVCGDAQHVTPDGVGGVYVAWRDARNRQLTDDDVYMQHLTADGNVAPGWPPGGLAICTQPEPQLLQSLIPDGSGGVIAPWQDDRAAALGSTGTLRDIYAQRVLPNGSLAPGWLVQGSPVTLGPGIQTYAISASDGAGGAYFAWEDYRDYPVTFNLDLYAQHLTGTGMVAPGWPVDGRSLCVAPGHQQLPLLASDGSGGAYAGWWDSRNSPTGFDLVEPFASHLLSDGSLAAGWTVDGDRLFAGQSFPQALLPDPLGGFYLVRGAPSATEPGEAIFVAQRFTPAGAPALGWPADGVTLCDAPGYRHFEQAVGDGQGGVLLTWSDFDRFPGPAGVCEVYVARLRPDGTRPPGWPANGIMVSDTTPAPYCEFGESLAPDGQGGVYVVWRRELECCTRAVIQHVSAAGTIAPGWPAGGLVIQGPSTSQVDPVVVSDGRGAAIVVWNDFGTLLAQRFVTDGVVATQLSLVRSEATRDRVVLVWDGRGASGLVAAVERRTEESAWQSLGPPIAVGPDRLRYEDRDVVPGSRYAYRLAVGSSGATNYTAETWLEVPRGYQVSLAGFRPNPASGSPTVAFALANASPTTLELLDVSGRRLATREVGGLGAGSHSLRFEGAALSPGMYWIRLAQAGTVRASVRGLVMR